MESLQRIRTERAEIARQRAAMDRRDADLAVAERILSEIEGDAAHQTLPLNAMLSVMPASGVSRRDRVVESLSGEKIWMTSAEINEAIAKRHGAPIKTTSFYPMLTTLKNDGVIVRDGERIALKSRADKEQADLIFR